MMTFVVHNKKKELSECFVVDKRASFSWIVFLNVYYLHNEKKCFQWRTMFIIWQQIIS